VNADGSWSSGELVGQGLVERIKPFHQFTRPPELLNWLNGIMIFTRIPDLQDLDPPGHHSAKGYTEQFCPERRKEEKWRR
jgi:hypothetical protein